MTNHKITNTSVSKLDMSPLHDVNNRILSLLPKEERVVDDRTFHDDIIQRVMKAGWLSSSPVSLHAPTPAAAPTEPQPVIPAAEVVPPEAIIEPPPEVKAEPPIEPTPVHVPVEPEPVPAPIPVETPVVSEQPAGDTPTTKSGKRR